MSTQTIELFEPIPRITLPKPAYLMCSPSLYDVTYLINPWMAGNLHATSRQLALAQWGRLYSELEERAEIKLIDPQPGSPDMVFTANAGLERDGTVVLSHFFYPERQAEEAYFRQWFQQSGYEVIEVPRETPFEGEGDALFSIDGSRLWAGYGIRTAKESHHYLERAWNVETVSLHLVDPRFYHLDTCFAPLNDGNVMYYPTAFDAASIARIEDFYPSSKRILVSEADAIRFACNAINIDHTLLINNVSRELTERLHAIGFEVRSMDLSEFLKAGGAAKCLVMKIGESSLKLDALAG